MCGISGILSLDIQDANAQSRIETSLDAIKHRGPDHSGVLIDKSYALGHVRLSIIDLSNDGNQPMKDSSDRFTIVYNGETYNYEDLISDVNLDINNLSSSSDTAVVLEAFKKLGVDLFPKLNGMFAFCIIDNDLNKAWLVRDRMGIKPLYYSIEDDQVLFCSEIKGLKKLCPRHYDINSNVLAEWAYYGAEIGDKTFHDGINQLLPGHFIEIDLANMQTSLHPYWLPEIDVVPVKPTKKIASELNTILNKAVKRHLVSDVPIGVFLSGGIDSSAITAFASINSDAPIKTYSVGFGFDDEVNELPMAARIAEKFKTDHHELVISEYDLIETLETLVDHHDYPFADAANIPLFLLGNAVKNDVKVVLQGDGGDELFGGYRRYQTLKTKPIWQHFSKLIHFVNTFLPNDTPSAQVRNRYINLLNSSSDAELMAQLLTVESKIDDPLKIFSKSTGDILSNHSPYRAFERCDQRFSNLDLTQKMLFTDTQIILPDIFLEKVDRSTMASGIEVRVPFLDNEVIDFAMGLPSHIKVKGIKKKSLLIKSLRGTVPDYVLDAPKTGFSVPYGKWLKGSLHEYFIDQLQLRRLSGCKLLDFKHIEKMIQANQKGVQEYSFLLWKVLNLCIWLNRR
jgi:asparagine synthase (glutamine-hydrolysing)